MHTMVRGAVALLWALIASVAAAVVLANSALMLSETSSRLAMGAFLGLIVLGIAVGGFAAASAALSGFGVMVLGGVQLLLGVGTVIGTVVAPSVVWSLTEQLLRAPLAGSLQLWAVSGGLVVGGAALLSGGVAIDLRRRALPATATARGIAAVIGSVAGIGAVALLVVAAPGVHLLIVAFDVRPLSFALVGVAAALFAVSAATIRWSGIGAGVAGGVGVAVALCCFAAVHLGWAAPQSALLELVWPNYRFATYGVLPVVALQLLLLGAASWFARARTPVATTTPPASAVPAAEHASALV